MSTVEPGTDRLLVAEPVRLLNDAEHYDGPGFTPDSRLAYVDRQAALLHRPLDALRDESSRYLAQDAEDRAEDVRSGADASAREYGDPPPAPRQSQ